MCGQCNVCQGGILGGRAVYCELGWCTMWYCDVLCGRVVYCVLG